MKTYLKVAVIVCLTVSPSLVRAHAPCELCHLNAAPSSGTAQLKEPLPALCIECHRDRMGNTEHIIDVPIRSPMSQPLPLVNGLLSCTTCHEPHSQQPGQLRLSANELCAVCHAR